MPFAISIDTKSGTHLQKPLDFAGQSIAVDHRALYLLAQLLQRLFCFLCSVIFRCIIQRLQTPRETNSGHRVELGNISAQ
ncbi:hypothetical protein D3C78_1653820 [compost metagenome]